MCPIKDLSDSVRLPRLGKIHLGTKHPEKGYPMKTDYFVFPKEHSDYDKLVEVFGEKPKELRILIPVEDEEQWASQYYRAYNQTYGLVCKGDGEIATRMVNVETGELPVANQTGTVRLQEQTCLGRDCPDYQAKKCHEVMNLRFLLPEVPGLGVWQIDTGSKNSILNINSCAKIIKRAFGRISLIPLKLTFEPVQVNEPTSGKKQTVYVLNLRSTVTIVQLADAAREQVNLLKVGVTLEDAFDVEVEKEIDDLWGEAPKPKPEPEPSPPPAGMPSEPEPEPEPEPVSPPAPESSVTEPQPTIEDSPVTKKDIERLDAEMTRAGWDNVRLGKLLNQDKKWNVKQKADLKKWQLEEAIKEIKATIGE